MISWNFTINFLNDHHLPAIFIVLLNCHSFNKFRFSCEKLTSILNYCRMSLPIKQGSSWYIIIRFVWIVMFVHSWTEIQKYSPTISTTSFSVICKVKWEFLMFNLCKAHCTYNRRNDASFVRLCIFLPGVKIMLPKAFICQKITYNLI